MLYKIVIYIYRLLSKDIRKKEAPWMLPFEEQSVTHLLSH